MSSRRPDFMLYTEIMSGARNDSVFDLVLIIQPCNMVTLTVDHGN
jgi:hypothetical protein